MTEPQQNKSRLPLLIAIVVGAIAVGAYLVMTLGDDRGVSAQGEEVEVVEIASRPVAPPTPTPRPSANETEHEVLRARVIRRLPHDHEAFTQGLLVHPDGRIFESTGLNGRSSVRQVDLESGEVQRQYDLPQVYFGEGLTRVEDRLIQITWQRGRAFEYDLETFGLRREFEYEGEGWGICLDESGENARLIMSDGSETLTFRDPNTFEVRGTVDVRRMGRPVRNLNELECVGSVVYANVWRSNEIVRIDPTSGAVTATIDARGLLTSQDRATYDVDVLNGIAYLPESQHFLITGKLWPAMFEVVFE